MVIALQICSCMLSDPVHLDPRSPNPISLSLPTRLAPQKLVEPRPPVDVLACPRSSVSHPAPISKCLVLLDLCLMCSAQLCVYAMYIVWTLLSASPLSPLLTSALSLSATWIYPLFHFAFLVTIRQEHARSPCPTPPPPEAHNPLLRRAVDVSICGKNA